MRRVNGCGRVFGSRDRGADIIVLIAAGLLMLCLLPLNAQAQVSPGSEESKIDAAWKAQVIDSTLETIDKNYVFPEVAREMVKHIRKKQKEKAYKDITDAFEFTQKLTDDMREICHDKHLGVRFVPGITETDFKPDSLLTDKERQQQKEEQLRDLRFDNFCFRKLERLEGNVGYLKFNCFDDAELGGATAVAAMNWLANSEALIIDLRDNGGGSPSMIQLISSYFFEEPTHLNDFYYRATDSTHQFWTQAHVQGPRMADMDLYILTSSYTFSGAEEFTYNMKNLERAMVIGETTGGGAHPVAGFGFPSTKVIVRVPYGRAVNPITHTNWEGTGIAPHIAVPREEALDRALIEAWKKIRDRMTDENVKGRYTWIIDTKEALANPHTVDPVLLQKYAGVYGPRTIMLENGDLYYQREDRPKYKMIAMTDDTFTFEDVPYFRIQVVTDDKGNGVELIGLYDNGRTDRTPRNP